MTDKEALKQTVREIFSTVRYTLNSRAEEYEFNQLMASIDEYIASNYVPKGEVETATKQAALNALYQLKMARINHMLGLPPGEWQRELDFIERQIATLTQEENGDE